MKKITILLFCLMSKFLFGQTARVYLDPFGSTSTTTGQVKLRVYNGSYDVTMTYDFSTNTYSNSPLSPPAGSNYTIEITNQTNKQFAYNMCQFGAVCDPNLGKFSACGENNPDNASTDSYSIIVPIGSTTTIKSNSLKILSNSNYRTVCQSNIGSNFNYELGSIHVRLSYDNRTPCDNINDVTAKVSSNAEYVNDSTYRISSGSNLNLSSYCSGVSGFTAKWSANNLSDISEIITQNKVYTVTCVSNTTGCQTKPKNVYVNVFSGCSLSNSISSITAVAINNDYEGDIILEIYAPAPTGNVTGSVSFTNMGTNNISSSMNFSQSNYDSGTGAYHVDLAVVGATSGGTFANPEIRNGKIKVKLNSEQYYNVNYSYTSYGYFDNAGRRPQGMSITYSPCMDGKTFVMANTEPKGDDHYYTSRVSAQRFRQIAPTVGSDILPFDAINHYCFPDRNVTDPSESCTSGAIARIGNLVVGQQYTYRVIGLAGESAGDYIDVSFTPTCPNPQVGITKSTICKGESTTLTVAGCNGNICWNTGQTTVSITVTPQISTTYRVSCLTVDNEYSGVTTDVTVINNTNILTITSNKTGNTIQPLENITLTASGCSGGTVKWDDGVIGDIRIESPTKSKDYYAYCQVGNCNSAVSKITVNVKPSTPTVVVESPNYCENTSNVVKLTASGCTGTYSWSDGTTGNIKYVPALTSEYWLVCNIAGVDSDKKYIKLKY